MYLPYTLTLTDWEAYLETVVLIAVWSCVSLTVWKVAFVPWLERHGLHTIYGAPLSSELLSVGASLTLGGVVAAFVLSL